MKNKWIALLLAVLMAGLSLPSLSLGEETRQFTDDVGRVVEVPAQITRIAPSGPLAQMVLFSLAPEMLVGLASDWDAAAEEYLGAYFSLPVLGGLYGTGTALNLEQLALTDPQLIIDIGEAKKTIVEDMDAITQQVAIPSVHIDATLRTMPDTYRKLGALLGMPEKAEVLAVYCEEAIARTDAIMAKVGDENRVGMLYLLGEKGQNAIAKGSFHSELFDMTADNLAVVESPSGKGTGNECSMEQIMLWDPDVIIFAPGSVYADVAADPVWQTLKAVQSGNYVEVPYGPYNWLGFPASVQRYLGMLWLPTLFYPDAVDYDLYTEVARYYDLFYHHALTQAQFDALTARATPPAK